MNLVKFILRGKLDGHTNLFNTQALFYAVLPHRVKVINVYPMGAYFNISTQMFVLLQFPAKAISMVYEQLNHRYSKFNQNCCEVYQSNYIIYGNKLRYAFFKQIVYMCDLMELGAERSVTLGVCDFASFFTNRVTGSLT